MDYYLSDTIADRPTTDPLMQPNTYAPMVLSEGQSNQYQWVSQRIVFGGIGVVLLLAVGVMVSRSTAIVNDAPIKIAAIAQPTVDKQEVNKAILEGSIEDLNKLIFLTDTRIADDKLALKNERAKEITTWANKLVSDKNADKNSDCYKSIYGKKCYLTIFINEQAERYRDAYRSRKWKIANDALFETEAARVAWIGAVELPLLGDATASAIQNELKRKIDIERQSDNAIASEMYGGDRK